MTPMHAWLKYLALIAALAMLPFLLRAPFLTHVGVMICLYTTLALSMNLMLRIGQISFAHGAFMGLGAYGSALFMMRLGLPFPVAFFGAALAVTLLAWLVGKVFLRIRGVYFVLLTFSFGEIIVLMFIEWVSLFGGSNGLAGVPRPGLFGYEIQSRDGFYLLALALAAVTYAAVRAIYRSELGAVITSLDENEALTRSLGIDSRRYRLLTFCFSSFLAGISGALYGHYLTLVTPDDYGFSVPVNLVVINVIGGVAHPIGSVLGALLLVPLPEFLRDAKQYQVLAYGLLLIFFLLFMPDGLYGAIQKLRRRGKGGAE
jgi:branched-chain amino acid transport system permease protein